LTVGQTITRLLYEKKLNNVEMEVLLYTDNMLVLDFDRWSIAPNIARHFWLHHGE